MPDISQGRVGSVSGQWMQWGTLAVILIGVSALPAQVAPEQAAEMLLDSARRAYNEKNYAFAAGRFREFLAKYGSDKQVPAARYGLALCLLDGPEKDYSGALEQLQPLAGSKDMPEYPFVLYYLGLSQRGLGLREQTQAAAKPQQEAAKLRASAQQRFEEAAKHFGAAVPLFAARAKEPPADAKELPLDLEWSARARCDQAEMQLRTLKPKDAQATAAPFLKDAVLVKSRYRGLGVYHHGFASFLLKDYLTAGRSLNQLAPYSDLAYGTHARYLLARIHHLDEERAEAATHYEAVITDHARQRQIAIDQLKRFDQAKGDPDLKARLEAFLEDPHPDHVARATFYLGVLLYENSRFADALTRFAQFVQQHDKSPLAAEARLRQGFCQVQLKQFAEAVKTLQPLAEKEAALADQALLWIAKAQVGAADPNAQTYAQILKTAIDTYRAAADKAQQLVQSDPEAKARRGEILIELADTQQLAKQYKEAAATYGQVLTDKSIPQRDEEVLQRQATALHLAGEHAESDKMCAKFQQMYPKSLLLPAVLFRHAENAYFAALAAENNPQLPDRVKELARLRDEAIKRYQTVVEKFPEFAHASLARYGLGITLYRKGELEKAKEALEAIPAQDRAGDLALVPYLLADCLIRLAPTKAEDALAAGRMEEQLKGAVELLETFLGSQSTGPQAPDALLKLGHCHQRRASLLAEPKQRAQMLATARGTYDRLMKQFPKHELYPQGAFERAKCISQAGDVNGAINELRRFTADPLKTAPIAPMALLQMATLLRGQNKTAEAAELLSQCRQLHEQNLLKDPARADWVPLLQYHHGVALREAGKRPEARTVFETMIKQAPNRPEAAEAALRWGQCLKEEGQQKVAEARKKLATPNLKPEESAAANKVLDEGMKSIRDAVQYFETQAEALKQKQPASEARARMYYEAAWGSRAVADSEVAAARNKIQQDLWQKLKDEVAKRTPPGQKVPTIPLPDVPLTAVPLQPAEQKARAQYQTLIAAFPELALANDARFELAELHADRNDPDTAIKLLREAIDKEPPAELTERIRIRLGACYAAKGDAKAALTQFQIVGQNAKSPLAGQARYRAGECLMQMSEWAEAAKQFTVFRDQQPFQNLAGISDRALLRLGHAHAQLKQWDQSRQALEALANRFGNSSWIHEARYGIGWAWQNQQQYDNAAKAYAQVTANTVTETGAKAQLQIGLCRLEQKKYDEAVAALLIVPFTYDYPELSAAALCEAARALIELKQRDQAEKLLRRVIKDHPDSKWADVAKERLEALKGI